MTPQEIEDKVGPELRINVEMGTQVLIQVEGMQERFKSTLIGMDPGSYLIVKFPQLFGLVGKLTTGSSVIVRYISEGSIYGFESEVLETALKPGRLIFLRYPKIVEKHCLRKFKRLSCSIPAAAQLSDKGTYEGLILDISRGGCKFSIHTPEGTAVDEAELDMTINLTFQLPGGIDKYSLSGKIRSLSKDKNQTSLGVEFDPTNTDLLDKIDQYVEAVIKFGET
jgi:c-di-GMP-binding flagellar brake protein YcgR